MFRRLNSIEPGIVTNEQLCEKLKNTINLEYMRAISDINDQHADFNNFEALRKRLLRERTRINLGTQNSVSSLASAMSMIPSTVTYLWCMEALLAIEPALVATPGETSLLT